MRSREERRASVPSSSRSSLDNWLVPSLSEEQNAPACVSAAHSPPSVRSEKPSAPITRRTNSYSTTGAHRFIYDGGRRIIRSRTMSSGGSPHCAYRCMRGSSSESTSQVGLRPGNLTERVGGSSRPRDISRICCLGYWTVSAVSSCGDTRNCFTTAIHMLSSSFRGRLLPRFRY